MEFLYVLLALFIIAIVAVIRGFKVVPQSEAYVIERLGSYRCTWHTGVHFLIPIFDKIAKRVSLKENIRDYDPQSVITKDNVTMKIDTVVFFQITDPKLYTYGTSNPEGGIANLTVTTLRNIIGELELDQTLTSRETVNSKLRVILDEATDPWGIKINRVELKNIIPPDEIKAAMEKQMRAERERRAAILLAEGEKASSILGAQGKKESQILEAEAAKQAAILSAEAEKEAKIRKAEGEAEAMMKLHEAQAASIRMINEANPAEGYIILKKLEAAEKVADGQATKIIIPSDLQNVVGLFNTVKESGSAE